MAQNRTEAVCASHRHNDMFILFIYDNIQCQFMKTALYRDPVHTFTSLMYGSALFDSTIVCDHAQLPASRL